MIVHQPPPWTRTDPRGIRRQRWLTLARVELDAAEQADEDHVAAAFRIVVATLEAGRLPDPPHNGRDVLKGRALVRERSISLAGTGLSCRAIACVVGEPYSTVYAWLRKAGVATSRAEWQASVRIR